MIVRVPASSANLGPGFDTLGMALGLHAEVGVLDGAPPEGAHVADEHHPATVAFRMNTGHGALWVRSRIPMGRGLGYSGAVRVAGIVAAHAQRGDPVDNTARAQWLQLATELEGHPDNVAASIHGGVVATAAGQAIRIPSPLDPAIVVWIPTFTTSTDASRATLPATLPFADAVFNVGRTALLVAALAAGDTAALAAATQDRLHQDCRLLAAEPSRHAMTSALEAGAWASWLSGSGPTVASFCPPEAVDAVVAALPADGNVKVLPIDHDGAVVVES